MLSAPIYSGLIVTLILALMATGTIWSRTRASLRFASVLGFLGGFPIAGLALVYVLGWPLPKMLALTMPGGDFAVLGTKMIVGKGIYVLLDEGGIPRYYSFPWDKKMSDKIQELLDSEDGKEGMRMKMPPYEFSWETREPPEVYALPQPKVLPEKPRQEEQPKRFDNI